ncbi:hypothetical protein pEaSNUABM11_00069 [Erwinia phage pEa_SNUABM_11]|nr:hypothetical protein pEaSNUABM11_00069 [Erwinia phage pEa_SNUABM_11]
MNYNMNTVTEVSGDAEKLKDAKVFTLHFSHAPALQVPRPVMLGIASFVQACYERKTERAELHYNSRTFTLDTLCDYTTYLRLQPLYKWAIDSGMDYMHKCASRDYSKLEHFFRAHVARVPELMDGYITVVTERCYDLKDMVFSLDIEQRLTNDTLLDDVNGTITSRDVSVTRLPSAKERLIAAQPLSLPENKIHRTSSVKLSL